VTALLLCAHREPQSLPDHHGSPSKEQEQAVARERRPALPALNTLGTQQTSAYQARLFADDDALVLVTQSGWSIFRNGEAAEQHTVLLGPVAVRQASSIVFWRAGALREISLDGANERRLAALTQPPRYLLASERRVAWIHWAPGTGASLQTLSSGAVRVVHQTQDRVCAAILRDAVVYWLVQSGDGSWRIESIGLDGQQRRQSAAHQGRPPALLAPGPDGVYFYDGPERGVRRLSFELDREDAVLKDVICSPLAVSNRAVCAQVGGLFEIRPSGTTPRLLAPERDGPIAALAATEKRVFWLAESGTDQLVIRSLPLPEL
jgi:hypothetical protein